MKQKIILLLLSTVFSASLYAQKEAYNWAFGKYAGLKWNDLRDFAATGLAGTASTTLTGLPESFTSKINTSEGCFTLSNVGGELMLYSDGITIWNGEGGQVFTGLGGHASSPQSGIILPYAGNPGKYICVGINQLITNRMRYVIVKATNRTDGEVEGGVVSFSGHDGSLGESMSAIRHANGTDWWIVAPGKNARGGYLSLNAWRVTSAGVQASNPVVTETTENFTYSLANGYFKFTPDGKFFVWATNGANTLVYGKFDSSTGRFSDIKTLATGVGSFPYGVEFSPNQKYLYIAGVKYLWIYDWEAYRAGTAMATPLRTISVFQEEESSALQLDPMGRIWANYVGRNMLVIDNPDDAPANLKIYQLTNFLPDGATATLGLPSFSASWWYIEVADIETDLKLPACRNKEIAFTANIGTSDLSQIAGVKWDFGDGTIIDDTNVDASMSQTHAYKNRGTYTLTVTPYDNTGAAFSAAQKTLKVKINSCTIPVNHNISTMQQ